MGKLHIAFDANGCQSGNKNNKLKMYVPFLPFEMLFVVRAFVTNMRFHIVEVTCKSNRDVCMCLWTDRQNDSSIHVLTIPATYNLIVQGMPLFKHPSICTSYSLL